MVLVIIILGLVLLLGFFYTELIKEDRDKAEKRATIHFTARFIAERKIEKIEKIINSEGFTFDKINKIKELVQDNQSQN